jgi:hypothetical protein
MTELMWLTGAFLAVGTPLYIAVGIVGADEVRAYRSAALARRAGRA